LCEKNIFLYSRGSLKITCIVEGKLKVLMVKIANLLYLKQVDGF